MSALLDLQSRVVAAIMADQQICTRGLVAIAEDKGNVVVELDAMKAKLGVCAMVSTPRFSNERETGNPHGDAQLAISVLENVLLNRGATGALSALEAAEHIACLLHLDDTLDLRIDSLDPLPSSDNGLIGYELTFKTRVTLQLAKEGA